MFPDSSAPAPRRDASQQWPSFASREDLNDRFFAFTDRAEHVLGLTRATRVWYRNGFDNFTRFLTEMKAPNMIVVTPDLLDTWLAWNRSRNVSGHTLRTYWNSLKSFIRSVANHDQTTNPFPFAFSPRAPQHNYKALHPSECERVLATVLNYPWATKYEGARNSAMLGVALYAGLRKREILRLEYRDVDLEECTIDIRRGKGPHGGKDRKAYICSELAQLLRSYLHERNLRKIASPEFFVSLRTKRGVSDAALRRVVAAVREASAVPFSLHVLRHSFVTMLLRSGVPIHIARDLAGHSNIQTTEGYARVFREDLRQHIQSVRFRTKFESVPDELGRQIASDS